MTSATRWSTSASSRWSGARTRPARPTPSRTSCSPSSGWSPTNPELRDALSDPARSVHDKRALLHGLLDGKVAPATVRLAEQSVAGTHRTVQVAIEEYQKVAAAHRSRLVATVRVARPLAEQDAQRLAGSLAKQYGRPVHLNVVVDPEVIGGVRVEIGDDIIDGTVVSRLDDARRRLAG